MQKLCQILILAFIVSFGSCVKSVDIHQQNLDEIQTYLDDNGLTAKTTSSGLHYIITNEGDGDFPTLNDFISVNYVGKYIDEWEFDNGADISFNLSGVIEGWQEGMQLVSRGGSIKLLIPSSLGYGGDPPNGIRENAVLIFDVDLLDF